MLTHWVTPPKLLSTTKAVIFSFTAPVAASLIGVLAKTVKISAMPPLLWKEAIIKWCGSEQRGQEIGLKGRREMEDCLIQILVPLRV